MSLQPNFQKGGLDRTSSFRGGCWEIGDDFFHFFSGGWNLHIKNKLKSEIFNDKKSFIAKKNFFSVITKNSNWEISPKNLVTFKSEGGIKDEKF